MTSTLRHIVIVSAVLTACSPQPSPPATTPSVSLHTQPPALSVGALESLRAIPKIQSGQNPATRKFPKLDRTNLDRDPHLSIYSLLSSQSVTLTPATAFIDDVGLWGSGTILSYSTFPTNGEPATGIIWVLSDAINASRVTNQFSVSLSNVQPNEEYLVDFVVGAVNDGTEVKHCQWVLWANDTQVQTTPCAPSNYNEMAVQHVFVVYQTVSGIFNYAELTNQTDQGGQIFWEFESAKVTRIQ